MLVLIISILSEIIQALEKLEILLMIGMAEIFKARGITSEALYKALKPNTKPLREARLSNTGGSGEIDFVETSFSNSRSTVLRQRIVYPLQSDLRPTGNKSFGLKFQRIVDPVLHLNIWLFNR